MTVEIPKLKVGDNMWLISDKGIKKEKVKHLFFWEKEIEEDTYWQASLIIESVSDDGSKVRVSGIIRYADPLDIVPFYSKIIKKESIIEDWMKPNNCGIVIKRVGDTIFENNREICR